MDPEHDRKISEHVLRMHRYRNPGEQDGEGPLYIRQIQRCCYPLFLSVYLAMPLGGGCDILATGDTDADDKEQDTPVFEKHDNLLHGDVNKR